MNARKIIEEVVGYGWQESEFGHDITPHIDQALTDLRSLIIGELELCKYGDDTDMAKRVYDKAISDAIEVIKEKMK